MPFEKNDTYSLLSWVPDHTTANEGYKQVWPESDIWKHYGSDL